MITKHERDMALPRVDAMTSPERHGLRWPGTLEAFGSGLQPTSVGFPPRDEGGPTPEPGPRGRRPRGAEETIMTTDPRAGQPADPAMLVNVPRLVTAYYTRRPDPAVPAERVAFGTSGHRGSALTGSFNEAHILAITEAICRHRQAEGVDGPLFLGIDTHALSEPAFASALEVLAAHGATVMIDEGAGY